MLRRFAALVWLFTLASCYDSPSDLVGEHANNIQKFDTLVVFDDAAYQVVPHGKSATICSLNTRADLAQPCAVGHEMKLERTSWGNYIVQIKDKNSSRYSYALWTRSDPNKLSADRPCFLWLGEGAVGNSASMSRMTIRHAGSADWDRFITRLKNVASEPPINRQQLLSIVKIYEDSIIDISADKWQCIGGRAALNNNLIAIEGDNRHLQPFTRPAQ
jgi:hypothetical protein